LLVLIIASNNEIDNTIKCSSKAAINILTGK